MEKQNDERKQSETSATCVASPPLSDLLAGRITELEALASNERCRLMDALDGDMILDAQHHAVVLKVYLAVKEELKWVLEKAR